MRRKIRLIKVVVPELVSYAMFSDGTKIPDYRCPKCGMGVHKQYRYCSACGSEFDWSKAEDIGAITAKDFITLGNSIRAGFDKAFGINSPSKEARRGL